MRTLFSTYEAALRYRVHFIVLALSVSLFLWQKISRPGWLREVRWDHATHSSCATHHFDQLRRGKPPEPSSRCNYPPSLYSLFKPLLNAPDHLRVALWNTLVLLCTLLCLAVPLYVLWRRALLRMAMPLIALVASALLPAPE